MRRGGGLFPRRIFYFNPRTPCGVRLANYTQREYSDEISIHAPLAGCDDGWKPYQEEARHISIHAPLAGCDRVVYGRAAIKIDFNPRTPCGVRHTARSFTTANTHFNPRTPCGVRRRRVRPDDRRHAFQSTHPLRGATAPMPTSSCRHNYFNPRTPCGVRLLTPSRPLPEPYFNPRTPCGVRPRQPCDCRPLRYFNPRTPCGVRRGGKFQHTGIHIDFNPRTPCGVRLLGTVDLNTVEVISIHAPLAGCDETYLQTIETLQSISIHAPLAGCD